MHTIPGLAVVGETLEAGPWVNTIKAIIPCVSKQPSVQQPSLHGLVIQQI